MFQIFYFPQWELVSLHALIGSCTMRSEAAKVVSCATGLMRTCLYAYLRDKGVTS